MANPMAHLSWMRAMFTADKLKKVTHTWKYVLLRSYAHADCLLRFIIFNLGEIVLHNLHFLQWPQIFRGWNGLILLWKWELNPQTRWTMHNIYMCIHPLLEFDRSVHFEFLRSIFYVWQKMTTTKAKTVVTGATDVVAATEVGLPDNVEVIVHIHYYCLSG